MFTKSFSFDGRIRRTEYGLSLIISFIVFIIISKFVDYHPFLALIYIPLFWFLLAQGTKRCHDLRNSGLIQFTVLYLLWMIFKEGDRHTNDYGSNPKKEDMYGNNEDILDSNLDI